MSLLTVRADALRALSGRGDHSRFLRLDTNFDNIVVEVRGCGRHLQCLPVLLLFLRCGTLSRMSARHLGCGGAPVPWVFRKDIVHGITDL